MEQYSRLPISVLESLPEADGEEIHRIYQEEWKDFGRKVLVLDDDPTGIQTVHDVSVYTDWSEQSLEEGMQEENSLFFVLTNSRSFSASQTEKEHKILAERAVKAAAACGKKLLLVSRGGFHSAGTLPSGAGGAERGSGTADGPAGTRADTLSLFQGRRALYH